MSELQFIPDDVAPIRRRGLRITSLMVGVLVLGGAIGMIGRGIRQSREAARTSQCMSNLKHIALALHNYHESYGVFPPAYVADSKGKPMHSWRVLITAYIDSNDFYSEYRFDEPWDSTHNRKLLDQYTPRYYGCPSRHAKPGLTSYVMIVGPKTLAPGVKSITLSDIRDGADQTIMVAEIANTDIYWGEPRDLDVGTMSWIVNDPAKPGISSPHERPNILYADGMVQRLDPATPPSTLKALTTIDGHEPVDLENPH